MSAEHWFDNQYDYIFRFLAFFYDPYDIRTFYFQLISNSLLQESDPIYMLIQRKHTPKLPKSKTDITYSWFTKISSYFLSTLILIAVSHYTPNDTSVIYTRTHALFVARITQATTILQANFHNNWLEDTQACRSRIPRYVSG